MTIGIRIGNSHGSLLIDDRFRGIALKTTAAVPGDITLTDAAGRTYVFGLPVDLGPGVGMRVYNSVDHSIAFDSRQKYIRIVDKVAASLVGSPVTKTYPSGKTYACGVIGFGQVSTLLQANPTNIAALLPTQFDSPSPSFSGTTLTAGKYSQTDDFNAPPHSSVGYHAIYRPNWTALVIDVTGY
jgi:hypothetical protein